MKWDFEDFFEKIVDIKLFENSILNKGKYENNKISLEFSDSKEVDNKLIYSPWSYRFFKLMKSTDEYVFIDEKYLLKIFDDYKVKMKYLQSGNNSFEYVSYEFMLNLHLARDNSSGKSHYKKMIEKMLIAIEKKGGVILDQKEVIKTKNELELYLKNTITNFTNIDNEMQS